MKRQRKSRTLAKIELANRRKQNRLKSGKPFPARRQPSPIADFDRLDRVAFENEKTGQTFDYLYKIFKNTRRGLNPNPNQRGEENPYVTGKLKHKGFPVIVLALKYPQSLIDSFKNIDGVSISSWVRKYA